MIQGRQHFQRGQVEMYNEPAENSLSARLISGQNE